MKSIFYFLVLMLFLSCSSDEGVEVRDAQLLDKLAIEIADLIEILFDRLAILFGRHLVTSLKKLVAKLRTDEPTLGTSVRQPTQMLGCGGASHAFFF